MTIDLSKFNTPEENSNDELSNTTKDYINELLKINFHKEDIVLLQKHNELHSTQDYNEKLKVFSDIIEYFNNAFNSIGLNFLEIDESILKNQSQNIQTYVELFSNIFDSFMYEVIDTEFQHSDNEFDDGGGSAEMNYDFLYDDIIDYIETV